MSSGHTEKLKRYLQTIMPSNSLEAFVDEPESLEKLVPTRPLSAHDEKAARSAAKKLATGRELTRSDQFALEAIIIPDQRPAILVQDDNYSIVHPQWTHFATDPDISSRLRAVLPSIGRIDLPDHPSLPYAGTGFVVGDGLMMTNRHVAEVFASGLGTQSVSFRPGHTVGIDFKREHERPASTLIDVHEVVMIHPYWDMALLRVNGLPAEQPRLVLSLMDPEDLAGREIGVIGYPAFDSRNDQEVQNKVFEGVYSVKRLQPGKHGRRRKILSFGKEVDAVVHDSSTLGGNSGSAMIDIATGHVVGLHFAGIYLDANFAVGTADLARDARVVDAGVNFAPGASPEAGLWREWWNAADPEEAAPHQSPGPGSPAARVVSAPDGSTWTVPLEVTVRVGAPVDVKPVPRGSQS